MGGNQESASAIGVRSKRRRSALRRRRGDRPQFGRRDCGLEGDRGGDRGASATRSSSRWSGTWPRPWGQLRVRRRVRRPDLGSGPSRSGAGAIKDNVEFDLAGTPCEDVSPRRALPSSPGRPREVSRDDQDLIDLGIESYLGVPLLDGDGRVLGHLAVFDERPLPAEPRRLFIFRIFATRAAVELERLRVEKQLVESERRYRELYEEAPNAYVAIGARSTAPERQPPGHAVARRVGDRSWWTSPYSRSSPRRRPAGAVRPRRSGALRGEEVSGRELEMRRRDGSRSGSASG